MMSTMPAGKTQVVVSQGTDSRKFAFSGVYGPASAQTSVYDENVRPMVNAVLDGYNATILAYGQSGSGKTHTMGTGQVIGSVPAEELGILPRVVMELFEHRDKPDKGRFESLRMSCSFVEIYQDEFRDLLVPPPGEGQRRRNIILREEAGSVVLHGVEELKAESMEEMMGHFEIGLHHRTVGSTGLNQNSSRSHAIFTVNVQMVLRGTVTEAKLNLVDLAGSERMKRTKATGTRAKEGISINKGLLTLGAVIEALSILSTSAGPRAGHSHVPYRDSKLTRLLQDSLGGSSRTLFIACVSCADVNVEESLNTLKYATRAAAIKNKPKRNLAEMMGSEEFRLKMNNLERFLQDDSMKDGTVPDLEAFGMDVLWATLVRLHYKSDGKGMSGKTEDSLVREVDALRAELAAERANRAADVARLEDKLRLSETVMQSKDLALRKMMTELRAQNASGRVPTQVLKQVEDAMVRTKTEANKWLDVFMRSRAKQAWDQVMDGEPGTSGPGGLPLQRAFSALPGSAGGTFGGALLSRLKSQGMMKGAGAGARLPSESGEEPLTPSGGTPGGTPLDPTTPGLSKAASRSMRALNVGAPDVDTLMASVMLSSKASLTPPSNQKRTSQAGRSSGVGRRSSSGVAHRMRASSAATAYGSEHELVEPGNHSGRPGLVAVDEGASAAGAPPAGEDLPDLATFTEGDVGKISKLQKLFRNRSARTGLVPGAAAPPDPPAGEDLPDLTTFTEGDVGKISKIQKLFRNRSARTDLQGAAGEPARDGKPEVGRAPSLGTGSGLQERLLANSRNPSLRSKAAGRGLASAVTDVVAENAGRRDGASGGDAGPGPQGAGGEGAGRPPEDAASGGEGPPGPIRIDDLPQSSTEGRRFPSAGDGGPAHRRLHSHASNMTALLGLLPDRDSHHSQGGDRGSGEVPRSQQLENMAKKGSRFEQSRRELFKPLSDLADPAAEQDPRDVLSSSIDTLLAMLPLLKKGVRLRAARDTARSLGSLPEGRVSGAGAPQADPSDASDGGYSSEGERPGPGSEPDSDDPVLNVQVRRLYRRLSGKTPVDAELDDLAGGDEEWGPASSHALKLRMMARQVRDSLKVRPDDMNMLRESWDGEGPGGKGGPGRPGRGEPSPQMMRLMAAAYRQGEKSAAGKMRPSSRVPAAPGPGGPHSPGSPGSSAALSPGKGGQGAVGGGRGSRQASPGAELRGSPPGGSHGRDMARLLSQAGGRTPTAGGRTPTGSPGPGRPDEASRPSVAWSKRAAKSRLSEPDAVAPGGEAVGSPGPRP